MLASAHALHQPNTTLSEYFKWNTESRIQKLIQCSAAPFCALRVAGIVVGVVMGHNRCSGVIKGMWGDRKGPMASGTNCEVEYRCYE